MKITPILSVDHLRVLFPSPVNQQHIAAVNDLSFTLYKGETLGVIGESGSGKSVTLLSLLGLVNTKPGIVTGKIVYNENGQKTNLLHNIDSYHTFEKNTLVTQKHTAWKKQIEKNYQNIRGNKISMIFQNPKLAFNPYYSIGSQINEMIRLHTEIKDKRIAKEKAIEWLEEVKMEAPNIRYNNNPYGLSGGMCQRAMIAMALSSDPAILIADEPTTGLDATIQSSIVHLLYTLKDTSNISMIVVSHDFNVIRQLSDRVLVYFNGRIVEEGKTTTIFGKNRSKTHPYSQHLINTDSGIIKKLSGKSHLVTNKIEIGCDFYHLCPVKNQSIEALCKTKSPKLFDIDQSHKIRCWKYQND